MTPLSEMSSMALFRREIRRFPRLSRDEEYRLACLWRDEQDRDAAKTLVCANLYAVAAIAREYRHFGLPEMDLIQEGAIGLMQAVRRFDPERGFRLMTYASWWVRAAIHDFILNSWSIVKLGTTKLQRKIFAGLQKAKNVIAAMEGHKAEEVGAEFGLSAHEYQEAATAFIQRDMSLDAESGEGMAPVHALPSPDATPEEIVMESNWESHRKSALQSALKHLPERDRMIMERRHLTNEPATLRELSEEFGVSIERVRQLESRALKKLRESISSLTDVFPRL